MNVKIVLVIALTIMLFTPILKLKADEVDFNEFLTYKQENIGTPLGSLTVGYKATSLLSTYDDVTHLNCMVVDYFQSINTLPPKKQNVSFALSIGIDYCLPSNYSFSVFKPTVLLGIDIDAYTSNNIKVAPFILTGGSYYSILSNDFNTSQYFDSGTYIITTGVTLYLKHTIAVVFRFNIEYDLIAFIPIYSGSITAGFWF